MAALARREHSRVELARKLKARGFAADAISEVLDELADQRLQSDSRHADAYIRSRAERGYGPQRIVAELKARGSTDDLIRAALAAPECDWSTLARQVDRKKFGTKPVDSVETLAKRRRFLEYRGFTAEHIKSALDAEHELD